MESERPDAGHGAVGRTCAGGRGTRGKSAGSGQSEDCDCELPACPPYRRRGRGAPFSSSAAGKIFSGDDQEWFLLLLLRLLKFCPSDREDENHPWSSTIVEQRSIISFPNFAREVINLDKFVFDVEAVCNCNE